MTQPDGEETAAPGWYPHSSMAGTIRYWDGSAWLDHVAPAPAEFTPADPKVVSLLTRSEQHLSRISGILTVYFVLFVLGCVALFFTYVSASDDNNTNCVGVYCSN